MKKSRIAGIDTERMNNPAAISSEAATKNTGSWGIMRLARPMPRFSTTP